MTVTIKPGLLRGTVTVPPSKSLSHRALIAAALAGGCEVKNLARNDDISATSACLKAIQQGGVCDCRESGSTIRFLMPLALALNGGGQFTGSPYLLSRPMTPFFDMFEQKGISVTMRDGCFVLNGRLASGRFALPGNVSSQFITGLLFSLPLLQGDSEITLTGALESKPYIELTLQVLSAFGISVTQTQDGYGVPGGQAYKPCEFTVEGDESAAAFWRTANALGSSVECKGLNPNSIQGDRVMENIILGGMRVIDVRECPDLVPALAVWGALREGETRIINAARLRGKECDRLNVTAAELNKLGANITELPDGLVINGVSELCGGEVCRHNDHRIVMAAAVAASRASSPVTIHGAEDVNKSYPAFWADFQALGGMLL